MSAFDSQRGNRGVSSLTVAVSPSLTLVVPVSRSYREGDCVQLSVDPLYRDVIARKDVPVMSMPVGSTFVERTHC